MQNRPIMLLILLTEATTYEAHRALCLYMYERGRERLCGTYRCIFCTCIKHKEREGETERETVWRKGVYVCTCSYRKRKRERETVWRVCTCKYVERNYRSLLQNIVSFIGLFCKGGACVLVNTWREGECVEKRRERDCVAQRGD